MTTHRPWLPLLAVLLLAACSRLTLANYDQVKVGMAYEDVTKLIGDPARCDETIGLRACRWGDEQRSVDITFAGGKVLLASAKNLK
ncbi:MAG TPA: hypothetical protein VLI72_12335 [Methylibium sp.]|nr:hypothetical protein [Methylibium sp.]